MKKFALVLGGGAAKGYAHIGVLKVLEKHNLTPDLIVGTSMGALVGGMFAAGYSANELEEMASKINSIGNFSLISTFFKGSVLNVNKVRKLLDKYLGEKKIEETKIPFIAIATDLGTGKEHRFKSGLMKDGIMASISIPGVFPSVKVGEKEFSDGGMVNNLPEDVARDILPDAFILSVDVIGNYADQVESIKVKTLETFINASTIMITNIMHAKVKLADLRMTISLPTIPQMEFKGEKALEAIEKGENSARRYISKIKKALMEK